MKYICISDHDPTSFLSMTDLECRLFLSISLAFLLFLEYFRGNLVLYHHFQNTVNVNLKIHISKTFGWNKLAFCRIESSSNNSNSIEGIACFIRWLHIKINYSLIGLFNFYYLVCCRKLKKPYEKILMYLILFVVISLLTKFVKLMLYKIQC